jgi:hypothetical protein
MFVLFQSIFTWAVPLSDLIKSGIATSGDYVKAHLANELLASLLSDGILAGFFWYKEVFEEFQHISLVHGKQIRKTHNRILFIGKPLWSNRKQYIA